MKWSLFLILLVNGLFGQSDKNLINQSEWSGDQLEENPSEFLGEHIADMLSHPIKINSADKEELIESGLLDIFQVSNLMRYREITGDIYTPYELKEVKGFDRALIEALIPFLDFSPSSTRSSLKFSDWKYTRHELLLRYHQDLQKRLGFLDQSSSGYLGPRFGSYLRYRAKVKNKIQLGFSLQNDPGESFLSNHNPMIADHCSGFVHLKDLGPLRSIVIGDYQATLSQGLAFWSAPGISSPGIFSQTKRYNKAISPYAGAEEIRYLRGLAFSMKLKPKLDFTAFASVKKLDARSSVKNESEIPNLPGSLITSGLHRTTVEWRNKNSNRLLLYGTQIKYRGKQVDLAYNLVSGQFKFPVPKSTMLYAINRFHGTNLLKQSIEVNYLFKKYNLYAEIALDHNGNFHSVAGMECKPVEGLMLGLSARSQALGYQALYISGPTAKNFEGERGVYVGLDWEVGPKLKLSASSDHYFLPWIGFRRSAPSPAQSHTIKLDLRINSSLSLSLLQRIRNDRINRPSSIQTTTPIDRTRSNFRIQLKLQSTPYLYITWRMEKCRLTSLSTTKGYMMYQDLGVDLHKMNLRLVWRISLMDIPNYDTRIYSYESDLLYRFSIPAYYGKAMRTYLVLKLGLGTRITLEGKISHSSFFDRDQISSGSQLVDGNKISNLALQMRFKF